MHGLELVIRGTPPSQRYMPILDSVEIPSLIRLIPKNPISVIKGSDICGFGLEYEQRKFPTEFSRYEDDVLRPQELIRSDNNPLQYLRCYQPLVRRMPWAKEGTETCEQLCYRIGIETKEMAQFIACDGNTINAYHLSDLRLEYVMSESSRLSLTVFGRGSNHFLNISDHFNLRWTFLTSFYDIKE